MLLPSIFAGIVHLCSTFLARYVYFQSIFRIQNFRFIMVYCFVAHMHEIVYKSCPLKIYYIKRAVRMQSFSRIVRKRQLGGPAPPGILPATSVVGDSVRLARA